MSGSDGFALKDEERRILIVGVNWLGDAIMSMPAIKRFRRMKQHYKITILTKPHLIPLWEMHPHVDDIIPIGDLFDTGKRLRGQEFEKAYILPNSFRSALLPWLGRIPERIGSRGQMRTWMLTDPRPRRTESDPLHQAYENFNLLNVEALSGEILEPELVVPPEARDEAARHISLKDQVIALIPGAARGPSKRWPLEHYIRLGQQLDKQHGYRLIFLGTGDDASICDEAVSAIGPAAFSLAGKTSMQTFAGVLARCKGVVANDSGGMHLAAAVRTPVVGIFGLTDPRKTGPLGHAVKVLKQADKASREISRDSAEAIEALTAIRPETAEAALLELLKQA